MKITHVLLIFLSLTLLVFSAGCGGVAQDNRKFTSTVAAAPQQMSDEVSSVQLHVEGISCGVCQTKIGNHLKKNPNVLTVEFKEKKLVEITYKTGQLTVSELQDIIKDTL